MTAPSTDRHADAPPAQRLEEFPRRFCGVCGRVVRREFKPGPGGRPDASCPRCGSLERHRFLALLLSALQPTMPDLGVLLDVAPTPHVTPLLARLGPRHHVRLDLGADNRLVDVLGSLTELPLPDASVDLLVCYHVLEHVPDDRSAMREIARVLGSGGVGLVQVPFRPGTRTDEDPSADEEERLRRFGQRDHVRYYGDDFEDRLVESGLAFTRVTPRSVLGERMCTWLKVVPDELVWIVRSSANAAVPPPLEVDPTPTGLARAFEATLDELTLVRGRLLDSRAETERLRRQLEAAGSGWTARRVARGVRRRAGRLLGRG
ncbi:class I SAM-dependent methyltransferase [Nocardioides sp. SYSU D00038]|uniref:class I SAM-dependent methyltransferase n=1 Tax=Nocardioides sp. SYSU D00038 TaxID=2812554 RepID=UPI0019672B7C|nr:class I SAM-dependent methyltransferase [Nocardioides sp. SYSU D00038]